MEYSCKTLSAALATLVSGWAACANTQLLRAAPTVSNARLVETRYQLSAKTSKPAYKQAEPVLLLVKLLNTTKHEVSYPDLFPELEVDAKLNQRNYFRLSGKNASGQTVFNTEYAPFHTTMLRRLPSGKTAHFSLKLNDFVKLKPGKYFITIKRKIALEDMAAQKGWNIEIVSKPVQVTIFKRTKNRVK